MSIPPLLGLTTRHPGPLRAVLSVAALFVAVLAVQGAALRFTETVAEGEFRVEEDWYEKTRTAGGTIHIVLPMQGLALSAIDENTVVSIVMGDLSVTQTLGADPNYSKGRTSAVFRNAGLDVINVSWNSSTLTITGAYKQSGAEVEVTPRIFADRVLDVGSAGVTNPVLDEFQAVILFGPIHVERLVVVKGANRILAGEDPFNSLNTVKISGVADMTPPKISIIAPAANQRVTASVFVVAGKASDASGVEGVLVRVGGVEFHAITTPASGGVDWSTEVDLQPGPNLIQATAWDANGNESTLSRTAIYVVTSPLTVQVIGVGTVRPDLNGPQEVGETLRLTARPGRNHLFAGWSGDVPDSINPVLTFVMGSEFSIQAAFITNHFIALKGRYSGLFYQPGEVQHASSGLFTATTTAKGSFSARLVLAGKPVSLRGRFTPDLPKGFFSGTVRTRDGGTLTVELTLDVAGGAERIEGTVSSANEGWTATLTADRLPSASSVPPGRYTMFFWGSDDDGAAPGGNSVGTIHVAANGRLRFAGMLADGARVSQAASVSRAGNWPLYVSLYRGRGSLIADMGFSPPSPIALFDFELEPGGDGEMEPPRQQISETTGLFGISGRVTWTKLPGAGGKIYTGGFVHRDGALGSQYTNAAPVLPEISAFGGTTTLSGGELNPPIAVATTLTPRNAFVVESSAARLALSLNAGTGLVRGSFIHPLTHRRMPIAAVVRDHAIVTGFFLGPARSGTVVVQPNDPPPCEDWEFFYP